MHEMALCESIRRIVEAEARRTPFRCVRRVRLEIGRLAGVELAALRFGFGVAMRGSVAEGADLDIVELPGEAWCHDCARTVEIAERLSPCPGCGGVRLAPTGGTDMRVRELEVI